MSNSVDEKPAESEVQGVGRNWDA